MDIILTVSVISIFGVVFSDIITLPGELFYWYEKLTSRLPDWLYKPLGGCAKCFAGQIALWYGFTFELKEHFILVVLTIFLTDILSNLYGKLTDS